MYFGTEEDENGCKQDTHMYAMRDDGESWEEIYVWHMSDVSHVIPEGYDMSQDLTDEVACDLLWALVGDGAHTLLEGSYAGVPGQSFEHPCTLAVTKTHIVLRRSGGLDI